MLRQTLAVCAWNIRSIGSRLPNALVVVIGFFTVIAVLSSVLATRDGIALSTARPGSEAIAVVSASNGRPDAHTLDLVGQTPGVLRDANGPMAGGVAVGVNWIRDWRPDTLGIMAVYGIERSKIGLLPNFRLLKGRMFRPGLNELMIGKGEVRLYPEFGLGKTMQWHHHSWKVVGEFETGSDVQDSMFLGDLHQIQAAIAKGNGYDFISAQLTSPAAFDAFKKSLESRPGSFAYVKRLSEQDSELGKPFQIILSLTAAVITLLMSVGAIFASLNVMYANVTSRTTELAVLNCALLHGFNYVAQHHVRNSQPTEILLSVFGIYPVVLIRNLYDCVASLYDHLHKEDVTLPMAYVPVDFVDWNRERSIEI